MPSAIPSYAIVTAAKNEEAYIERTIKSVISQTVHPAMWVVVDDGSTDRTAQIIEHYRDEYSFIRLVSRRDSGVRDFSAKVRAFEMGRTMLASARFELIANLDADIVLPEHYYELIGVEFSERPRLGIAGGAIWEFRAGRWRSRPENREGDIAGGLLVFRRWCYESIGGYRSLPFGGEDTLAQVLARAGGWEVRGYPELVVRHLKSVGSKLANSVSAFYRSGVQDFYLGYHPVYYGAKLMRRSLRRPFLIGSMAMLLGYFGRLLAGCTRGIGRDTVALVRAEQVRRLAGLLRFGSTSESSTLARDGRLSKNIMTNRS
jgi:biofilm PGA synthesis N-glycosyltransferase PgaC